LHIAAAAKRGGDLCPQNAFRKRYSLMKKGYFIAECEAGTKRQFDTGLGNVQIANEIA
jgi:hypothetical protein